MYFAKITFEAQKQTEQHTSNAPKSAQIGKLKDLPRHFYRNLICACAMTLKYYDDSNKKIWGKRINYPSESNVLKLKTLPDEIIYDIDEEENHMPLGMNSNCCYVTIIQKWILQPNISLEKIFLMMPLTRI